MKTLEQYLRDAMHAGIHWPDHSLRATAHDGYVSFYIHPSGIDGETLNFNVYGNDVRPWEVEGGDPGTAARPREFPMVTDDRNSIDTIEELEAYREKGYFQAMGFYPAASNNKRNVVAPEEDRDINGIRRRNHLDRLTPLETQAWKLLQAVEDAGCHPLLTDASVMILALRNKLADWVDEGSPGSQPWITANKERARALRDATTTLHDAAKAVEAEPENPGVCQQLEMAWKAVKPLLSPWIPWEAR